LNKSISFDVIEEIIDDLPWIMRGNLTCPHCGNITSVNQIKEQSKAGGLEEELLAVIEESAEKGKHYRLPNKQEIQAITLLPSDIEKYRPKEKMMRNSAGGDTFSWGYDSWGQLFNKRQLYFINELIKNLEIIKDQVYLLNEYNYSKAINTFLAIYINKIAGRMTSFGVWNPKYEKIQPIFSRQAIPMVFDYPEANPFSENSTVRGQIDWIVDFIISESGSIFSVDQISCASSDDKNLFEKKCFNATITDPPYYDAIAYADLSDFFYIFFKKTLKDEFESVLSFPQTPKTEECTALKFHHNGITEIARDHFNSKLKSIFECVENQTQEIISIMFAHQSTEAWTTLCNSILSSNMNITGSWANDTEMTGALKTDKAFLSSSVTVSCKPAQRQGTGDSKEVKAAIELKVKNEVEELYKLGFRGADLLTACFGPAVSEFGKYERVEKASGEEVTVEELLTWARDAAFNAIVSDIPTDDFTRFYIGWLNLFGFSETEHDDVRRITQIGLHIDVNELLANHLLIRNGNKQTLATFITRAAENKKLGDARDSFTIDLVHKALYLLKNNNRKSLLEFIGEHAQNQEDIFWRVANSLKEVLPKGMEDQKQVSELLANKDNLIKDSKNIASKLDEQEDMFNQ